MAILSILHVIAKSLFYYITLRRIFLFRELIISHSILRFCFQQNLINIGSLFVCLLYRPFSGTVTSIDTKFVKKFETVNPRTSSELHCSA